MAKFKVVRALDGFALKIGQIVTGESLPDINGKPNNIFLQHNVMYAGDKCPTFLTGVVYDFELVEE